MVFTINSKDLLQALKDTRAIMKIKKCLSRLMDYESFWLEVADDDLKVSVASRDRSIMTVKVPVMVVDSDEYHQSKVFVSQSLYSVVRTLDPQDLTIDLTADKMEIQHACGVVRFPTLTGSDIVVCGPLTFGYDRMIFLSTHEADELRLILSTLKPFMGDDEFRPVMNGICVKCTDEHTDYVASDGQGLCRIRIPRNGFPYEILIPYTVVSVIQKVLPKAGQVSIYYKRDDLTTQIEAGNIRYIFQRTKGPYPNYQKVIPDLGPCPVSLERQKLVRSLNRIMALDRNGGASLKMSINYDNISLFYSNDELATDEERVPICDRVATGEHYVFVNPCTLLKCVSNLQSDIIQLSFNSSRDPVVIHPYLPLKDGDATVILMPRMG